MEPKLHKTKSEFPDKPSRGFFVTFTSDTLSKALKIFFDALAVFGRPSKDAKANITRTSKDEGFIEARWDDEE